MKLDNPSPLPTLERTYGSGQNSGRWVNTLRKIQILYAVVCFLTALSFHLVGTVPVSAQARDPGYELQSKVDVNTNMVDQLWKEFIKKTDQLDHHIDNTDSEVKDLRDQVVWMKGIGIGASLTLGTLQAIGMVGKVKMMKAGS